MLVKYITIAYIGSSGYPIGTMIISFSLFLTISLCTVPLTVINNTYIKHVDIYLRFDYLYEDGRAAVLWHCLSPGWLAYAKKGH